MKILHVVLIALLVGGGAFYAGMKYQESKRSAYMVGGSGNVRQGLRTGNGTQNSASGRTVFRPVAGEVIKSDESTVTVKMQDGSTKIVLVSDKTEVNKAESVSREALTTGVQVAVFGTENPDGSVTAQSIQLDPVFRGR